MESNQGEPLEPQLEEAKETLSQALEDACSTEVEQADTGELIRLEETLAIAGEAAKKAVSIRRKLGGGQRGGGRGARRRTDAIADLPEVEGPEVSATEGHRFFTDGQGVRWDAFAVHPTSEVSDRAKLPEPYSGGWLSFDGGVEKRRLSPIPEGWQTMPDEGLQQLCERAEVVRRRSGPADRRTEER